MLLVACVLFQSIGQNTASFVFSPSSSFFGEAAWYLSTTRAMTANVRRPEAHCFSGGSLFLKIQYYFCMYFEGCFTLLMAIAMVDWSLPGKLRRFLFPPRNIGDRRLRPPHLYGPACFFFPWCFYTTTCLCPHFWQQKHCLTLANIYSENIYIYTVY